LIGAVIYNTGVRNKLIGIANIITTDVILLNGTVIDITRFII